MKYVLPLFLVFLSLLPASAQKRRLSFSQLLAEIRQSPDSVFKLRDAEVYPADTLKRGFSRLDQTFKPDSIQLKKSVLIEKHLIFERVSFRSRSTVFANFIFRRDVIFLSCQTQGLNFANCRFENNFRLNNYDDVVFYNCEFYKNSVFNYGRSRTRLEHCVFGEEATTKIGILEFSGDSPEHSIVISNCQFNFSGTQSNVRFFLKFSEISLKYSRFKAPVIFSYIFVRDKFAIRNCEFEQEVIFATPNIPIENTSITWSDLQNKISVLKDSVLTNVRNKDDYTYRIRKDADFSQEADYDELIATYSKFLQVFKFRSNSEYYNACYIEMRDIMTRKSEYEYRKNPDLRNYLDWKIKTFLKEFSDYGTDYTKSILYALKVILVFALIFFIFPSETDNLSRSRFFPFFSKSIDYFKTDKPLMQVYEEQKEKELTELKNFRENLISSKNKIPNAVSWFAQPVYQLDLAVNSLSLWILKKTDFIEGRWEDLSEKRKFQLSLWVFVFFLSYILWGILIRALNAFALSLNSLTTLGYGGISAQGISRYLAVIEGLTGWFLLTIFSVSLIGQVL